MAFYSKLYLEVEINHALELSKVLVHAHANEYPKYDEQMELMAALLYGPVVARTSDEWTGTGFLAAILSKCRGSPYLIIRWQNSGRPGELPTCY
ncbi:MAG: hypothetical protein ACE5PV_09940 [Candidatus Poribacteria bacterium]